MKTYLEYINENKTLSLVEQFKNTDNDFYNKITNTKGFITANKLAERSIIKKNMLRDQGDQDSVDSWIDYYFTKDENTKPNTYYHINTKNEEPYSGLGNGLYIGRDPEALIHFYDPEENGFTISEYDGNPKWLELTDDGDYTTFKDIIKEIGYNIVNSDVVGSIVTQMGFDGIRYYDYNATGEEFVLFNQGKLRKIK